MFDSVLFTGNTRRSIGHSDSDTGSSDKKGPTAGGTRPLGAYSASDLRTAYQIPTFPDVPKFAVANDNKAHTLSISYGLDEGIQGNTQIAAEGVLFQQLASEGITVFVGAGDRGAYGASGVGDNGTPVSLNVVDPGSQPFVPSVGGTALFTGPNQTYGHEEVWNTLGRLLPRLLLLHIS